MISTVRRTTERGVEELAAFGAFAAGEFGDEVFVDLAEKIAGEAGGDVGEGLKELVGDGAGFGLAGEAEVFVLGQDACEAL
jgi:hypothetical protein